MAILAPDPLGQKLPGIDPLGPVVITAQEAKIKLQQANAAKWARAAAQQQAAQLASQGFIIGTPNGFLGEDPGANLNLGPKPSTKVPTAVPKPVPKPPVAKLPPPVIPKVPKLPPLPPLPPPTLPPSVAPSAAGGGGAAGGGIILLIGLALLASFGKR